LRRDAEGHPLFYFRDVLPLLNHRYVVATAPELIPPLVDGLVRHNRIWISVEELDKTPFLAKLFTAVERTEDVSDYLLELLTALSTANTDALSSGIEREFMFHYYTTVNRMKEVMRESGIEMGVSTYFRLLERMTALVSIPFRGEPLAGLQVMGVLETRALDFDRLIILSMNEGTFPARKAPSSFIPYNLRRGFGLPTYEHQDSIWAYHFYRLLYRASQVHLLYDSRSGGLQSGEMSRFIHQLRYHYELPLKDELVVYNVSSSQGNPLAVEKSEAVRRRLDVFRPGGDKALSASALNTWLDCPLKFYLSYVEGVEEEDEVSETVESDVFGSIVHKVMERLYAPFCGKLLTADLLKKVRSDNELLTHTIEGAFAEIFFQTPKVRPLSGQNYLIGEMIRKYVVKVLERDAQKLTPFTYLASEKRMEDTILLSDGSEVRLKGFIDRIDRIGDTVRIIDYKSGLGVSSFATVDNLFDASLAERPKAVMQVFLYCWLYSRQPTEGRGQGLHPGIYYLRTLFNETFDSEIYCCPARGQRQAVDDFALYAEEYEAALRQCLDAIFSPEQPFTQASAGKGCSWCPFKSLCGR
ncbi:MAG: PD-(D/E)XK nuclease family protein, partial [Tannerella sp.]|jgi:hypothetical protein|nr:PD-(D/E)XK nuclease family protein [Tannerella sp.]